MIPLAGTSTVPSAVFATYSTAVGFSPTLNVMLPSFFGFHCLPSAVVITPGV